MANVDLKVQDVIDEIIEQAKNSIICDDPYGGADIDEENFREELVNILEGLVNEVSE